VHQGLTHMKTLITSNVALIASGNFTKNWERDHNYFISASSKPALYLATKDRFEAMWHDTANYQAFQPLPPKPAGLQAPLTGAAGVPTSSRLVWRRTPWAVAFDVYLGSAPGSLSFAGRVNAVLNENPPATYSFAPQLQASTKYYWQVVSRTLATDHNPGLVAGSEIWAFTTASNASPGVPPPSSCAGPAPATGWTCVGGAWVPPAGWTPPAPTPPTAPSAPPPPTAAPTPPPGGTTCTTVRPGPDWQCLNGGWVPPGWPTGPGAGDPGVQQPAPPQSGSCTTIKPGPDWVCFNGGWVPPGWPTGPGTGDPGIQQPAPPTQSAACTTIKPGPDWLCFNGGWVPPGWPIPTLPPASASRCALPSPGAGWTCVGSTWQPAGTPSASCGGLPDPFAAHGGGVCIGGGWVPRNHPLAGGRE